MTDDELAARSRIAAVATTRNLGVIRIESDGALLLDGDFTAADLRALADALEGRDAVAEAIRAERLRAEVGLGMVTKEDAMRAVADARREEREACAQIADEYESPEQDSADRASLRIAAAIRARGKPENEP